MSAKCQAKIENTSFFSLYCPDKRRIFLDFISVILQSVSICSSTSICYPTLHLNKVIHYLTNLLSALLNRHCNVDWHSVMQLVFLLYSFTFTGLDTLHSIQYNQLHWFIRFNLVNFRTVILGTTLKALKIVYIHCSMFI
jgi:hypothetical protein